jgi:hypothetical protein
VSVQSQYAGSTGVDSEEAKASEAFWFGYFESRSIEDRNRLVLFYAPLVKLVF